MSVQTRAARERSRLAQKERRPKRPTNSKEAVRASRVRGVASVQRANRHLALERRRQREQTEEQKAHRVFLWVGHGDLFAHTERHHTRYLSEIDRPTPHDTSLSVNPRISSRPHVLSTILRFLTMLPDKSIDGILLCYPPRTAYHNTKWVRHAVRVLRPNGYISHVAYRRLAKRKPSQESLPRELTKLMDDRSLSKQAHSSTKSITDYKAEMVGWIANRKNIRVL